mgnify:CR=1 FL=1
MSRQWKKGDILIHFKTGNTTTVRAIYTDTQPHVVLLEKFPDELGTVNWWKAAGWRLKEEKGDE